MQDEAYRQVTPALHNRNPRVNGVPGFGRYPARVMMPYRENK